jgi:hypothetical protein
MTVRAPSPISPSALVDGLAARVLALKTPSVVLVDGSPATEPAAIATALTESVRTAGRPALHVDSTLFWRDASIRLEFGREDVDSYLDWVDAAALRREVVDQLRNGGPVLPSLRDRVTNRATRAEPVAIGDGVVLISGAFLLRHDLDADLVVHLSASAGALARRLPEDQAWTIPAFARYDRESHPATRSDVLVRCEDPKRPAVVGLS